MDKLVAEIVRKPKMDRKWKPTQKWIGNGDKMKKNGREMEWKQKLRSMEREWKKMESEWRRKQEWRTNGQSDPSEE